MNRQLCRAATVLFLAVWSAGCGDLGRDNPFDPAGGIAEVREQLGGDWSHESADRNEVYVFKTNSAVELWDYSSTDGDPVNRDASWPDTRVRVFTGTYEVTGKLLGMSFTTVQSNDPNDDVAVPPTRISVEISIKKDTLTFDKAGGRVYYTRHN